MDRFHNLSLLVQYMKASILPKQENGPDAVTETFSQAAAYADCMNLRAVITEQVTEDNRNH
jgi:hypothetical protein